MYTPRDGAPPNVGCPAADKEQSRRVEFQYRRREGKKTETLCEEIPFTAQ
jgi:hypothetical protein